MGKEQRPFAEPFGVHDGGHRFAGAGGVVEQGDGLKIAAHLFQSCQSLLLVLLQFQLRAIQGLAPLSGEIVLNFLEAGMLAQEYPQFIFHGFRLLLYLPHRPAVYIPAQADHAVLLEQVIVELVLGD